VSLPIPHPLTDHFLLEFANFTTWCSTEAVLMQYSCSTDAVLVMAYVMHVKHQSMAGFWMYEAKASRLEIQLLQPKQLYRLEFKAQQASSPNSKNPTV